MSNSSHPQQMADEALALALAELKRAGVAGEAGAGRAEAWKAQIRLGEIEQVEGSTTRALRVTALAAGGRRGSASTSELSSEAVRACTAKAVELASFGDADPWVGLPPAEECGQAGGDLATDDPAYAALDRDALLQSTIRAERIALDADPRISNAHRSSVRASRAEHWYGSTDGVRVHRVGTVFGYSVTVVARDANGERQTGGYGSHARHLNELWSPDEVGREAGARAVRWYGWRTPPNGPFPVVFHHEAASDLLGTLISAISGGAVYRGSTYLANRLGTPVASDLITVVDDPLIPRASGSRPCDGEGVRSRRTTLVDAGRLNSFLVDGYAARRLSHPYTGHDGGATNVRLLPGTVAPAELLTAMGTGLLIHDLHGFGIDLVSGTYSRGVSGFWVENGIIAYPVQEATIAANLNDVLAGIRLVGNDPLPQSSISSPSLLIDGFTIASNTGTDRSRSA